MAVAHYSEAQRCACGNQLKVFASSGRTQYQCRECRLKRTPTAATCCHCGAQLQKTSNTQKFCSVDCCQGFHASKKRKHPPGYLAKKPACCNGCRIQFVPKGKSTGKYCSRACAFKQAKAWNIRSVQFPDGRPPFSQLFKRWCKSCGNEWLSGSKRSALICGVECAEQLSAPKPRTPCTCMLCRQVFMADNGNQKLCSDACKRKHRRRYGGNKHIHRARKYGVAYESINVFKVFDRDGWRCQMCGKPTPKSKRGTYAHNAPELDHIVPISMLGPHVYANVQCACRDCNGKKGATLLVPSQMPLLSMS